MHVCVCVCACVCVCVCVCVCARACACACVQTMPLIPLSRLAPRLRRSVEGLNLELEGVFVSETAKEQHKVSVYMFEYVCF